MASWVEINDPEAARGAGRALTEAATELDDGSEPPVAWGGPEWGDDEFSQKIQENLDYPTLVPQVQEQKQQLSEFFADLGTGLRQAIAEYTGEEGINTHELDQVQPPAPNL